MLYQNNEHWHGEAASVDVASAAVAAVASAAVDVASAAVDVASAAVAAGATGTSKQLPFLFFIFMIRDFHTSRICHIVTR